MTIRFKMPISFAFGPFVSGVGNIVAGSRLRFYDTGGSTPRAVYSDKELSTAITQPIACDSAGRFPDIYLQSGLYKVRWETSAGVEIDTWDYDDPGLATGGSGGILAVADGGTGASTAGGALTSLGAASASGLSSEIAARQALDTRVTTLETASSFINPGGRLTLTSATPVLSSDVTAAATVYYTPYLHNRVMLYSGSAWSLSSFSELSQALSDTTKSPAAAANNSAYDMFVWSDSGTMRCTRGPAWSSVTSRGTGAGTTELERVDGVWLNKVAITNGPAANRGLYVGTICTNGSAQLAMMFAPSAAAGGSANRLDVWNMYNQVNVSSMVRDSTNTWASTSTTWQSFNASTSNRCTFVRGFADGAVSAKFSALASNLNSVEMRAGIGFDSTSALSGLSGRSDSSAGGTNVIQLHAHYSANTALGQHYFQMIEGADATTGTWIGDNGTATTEQSGMIVELRM